MGDKTTRPRHNTGVAAGIKFINNLFSSGLLIGICLKSIMLYGDGGGGWGVGGNDLYIQYWAGRTRQDGKDNNN